jgi:hypothetical protein
MKFQYSFLLFLLLIACSNSQSLEKVPYDEYLSMINENRMPDRESVTILDPFGHEISQDSLSRLAGKIHLDEEWYRNEEGQVVEMRYKPKPPIPEIEINCESIDSQLDSIYQLDQASRNSRTYDPGTDYTNLVTVVNILKQCGMPESRSSVNTIFLVIQHNHSIYQKKYIDTLKKAAEQGLLSKSSIAMMEDRILVDEGKPQIYGSQVGRKRGEEQWTLYELIEPERVNARRAKMGMGPIEEYLKNFGIEFSVEQEPEDE